MIVERICPVCKKNFVPAAQHVYRDKHRKYLVCSYTCMLESRRSKREGKVKRVML